MVVKMVIFYCQLTVIIYACVWIMPWFRRDKLDSSQSGLVTFQGGIVSNALLDVSGANSGFIGIVLGSSFLYLSDTG